MPTTLHRWQDLGCCLVFVCSLRNFHLPGTPKQLRDLRQWLTKCNQSERSNEAIDMFYEGALFYLWNSSQDFWSQGTFYLWRGNVFKATRNSFEEFWNGSQAPQTKRPKQATIYACLESKYMCIVFFGLWQTTFMVCVCTSIMFWIDGCQLTRHSCNVQQGIMFMMAKASNGIILPE